MLRLFPHQLLQLFIKQLPGAECTDIDTEEVEQEETGEETLFHIKFSQAGNL